MSARFGYARENLEQRALASSVTPDNPKHLTFLHLEAHFL